MVNNIDLLLTFFNQRKVENIKVNGKDDIPYMKVSEILSTEMSFGGLRRLPRCTVDPNKKQGQKKGVTTYDLPLYLECFVDSGNW